MPTDLNKSQILENLELLSEWLSVKYPDDAIRFVLSIDNDELRKEDLRIVLNTIGFDFNEFTENNKR